MKSHKTLAAIAIAALIGGASASAAAKVYASGDWGGAGWYVVGASMLTADELMKGPFSNKTRCAAAARPIQDFNKDRGEVSCKHYKSKPADPYE